MDSTCTSAEFKATAELLGLPLPWLAERYNVHKQTVARWMRGKIPVPQDVSDDMRHIVHEAAKLPNTYCELVSEEPDSAPTGVLVPSDNAIYADLPGSFWRIIGLHISTRLGVQLGYYGTGLSFDKGDCPVIVCMTDGQEARLVQLRKAENDEED